MKRGNSFRLIAFTPRVGLEPTTLRLTAECSTIELSRIIRRGPSSTGSGPLRLSRTAGPAGFASTCLQNRIYKLHPFHLSRSSPRPISSSQLHALQRFHLCPINLIVSQGSYRLRMGYLISRGASRLDAFSVYPFQARLPGCTPGNVTGTPAACPSRSSRTKDSSSQISSAHAG
jgi:hypothetical protein